MKLKKEEAIKLRKTGKSYNQINKSLNVAKSTLSYWLKDVELSDDAKNKISERVNEKSTLKLIERNIKQTELANDRAVEIIKKAKLEFKSYCTESLFLTGVSLYWAEGYKKGANGSRWKVVDFTNSDSDMIVLMMKFFKRYFRIENKDFKIQLITHPSIDIERVEERWSSLIDIPKSQFFKTYSKLSTSSKEKRNKKSLPFGTLHIRIYKVELFFRMIGWIEGLKEYNK